MLRALALLVAIGLLLLAALYAYGTAIAVFLGDPLAAPIWAVYALVLFFGALLAVQLSRRWRRGK